MLIHVSIIYGCFRAITGELCNDNRLYNSQSLKYLSGLLQKICQTYNLKCSDLPLAIRGIETIGLSCSTRPCLWPLFPFIIAYKPANSFQSSFFL